VSKRPSPTLVVTSNEFAARYGFSVRRCRNGSKAVPGRCAVRAYLMVIDYNSDAVRRALAG